jgi:hypothetical protein
VAVWLSSGVAVAGRPDPPCPPPTAESSLEKYRRRQRCDLPSLRRDPWGSDLLQAAVNRNGSLSGHGDLCKNTNNQGRPSHSAWLQFDNTLATEEPRDGQYPRGPMSNDPNGRSERSSDTTFGTDESPPSEALRGEGGDSQSISQNAEPQQIRTPLLYRYYGKSRTRTPGSGSIPFVLLGPNVDHFKLIGQELASRGFSVLACERVAASNKEDSGNVHRTDPKTNNKAKQSMPAEGDTDPARPTASAVDPVLDDGAILIGELLGALKWNRVVLVGCDAEALTAVQAAVQLAPSGRVAGLVLCGDLKSVMDMILVGDWDVTVNGIRNTNKLMIENFGIDLYLQDRLQCPFTVVWSGDSPSLPLSQALSPAEAEAFEALSNNRYLILGGGAAPHRRRPELFAWVLTRFVEEKIAGTAATMRSRTGRPLLEKRGGQQDDLGGIDDPSTDPTPAPPEPRPLNRLVRLQEFLSPGSFLVTGRMIATMLFYWSVMKVGIHQFDNICTGMVNVQSAVKHVDSWRAATFRFAGRVLSKIGGLFLITSYTSSSKSTDSEVGGTSSVTQQEMGNEGPNSSIPGLSFEEDESMASGSDEPPSSDEVPNVPPALTYDESTPQSDTTEGDDDSKPRKNNESRPRLFFLDHVVA